MKVDVVEYYPFAKKGLEGTMHVYLTDMGMDIRGIKAKKNKHNQWSINFPVRVQLDLETNENVIFPIFSFTDPVVHLDFIQSIRRACREYLKKMDPSSKKMYGKAKFEKKKEVKNTLTTLSPFPENETTQSLHKKLGECIVSVVKTNYSKEEVKEEIKVIPKARKESKFKVKKNVG